MLTRLKVNGFKNLVDVDVRFGPFTCIAGVNAAGKSNLFDAIRFLSLLAEKPLVEAGRAVRGSGSRSIDIRSLFTCIGDEYVDEMSFEAEMIVPAEGVDDRGLTFEATETCLRYGLKLSFAGKDSAYPGMPLRIVREYIQPQGQQSLGFRASPDWAESTVSNGYGTSKRYLDTETVGAGRLRWIEDGSPELVGAAVFNTYLASGSTRRSPSVMLVRQEMRSWRVFSLDPAKIGETDSLLGPPEIGEDGAHVAAALYRLAHEPPADGQDAYEAETAVYARVSNRLAQLVNDIRDVEVDLDSAREALTILATDRSGAKHPARALSDGTLRFLALAVLEQQETPGVYCIEEPENGIHPGRIPALLKLLQAIAMDTNYAIEPGNPLRQVIISTHSPSIVSQVPGDSLVIAELQNAHRGDSRFKRAVFRGLANTWRDPKPGRHSLALGTLLRYLNPDGYRPLPELRDEEKPDAERRILDRDDVRSALSPTPQS